ncbi:MAG: molybdate ABC transporter permease subunit [Bdellovibrionales bacterium]|nr:molybdate ABC transporter permease subunit [Bdellovibrionales bacterium]
MTLNPSDWQAIALTLKLALVVTVLLLVLGTLLAFWFAGSKTWYKGFVESLVSLPLVLPPTVLGFYLLIALGPEGVIGQMTQKLGIGLLPFSFSGLVFASVVYSLPFVIRPIQNSIEAIGTRPMEVAATLGSSPWDSFFSVVLPMSRPGLMTAFILGFAHTLGEFGVVLMIGGNIPGVTRVISVHIYDQVEALEYGRAHWLSALMVVFSFVTLVLLHFINRNQHKGSNSYGF